MSIDVEVDIEGVEQFQAAMNSFGPAMQMEVWRFLQEWAQAVKLEAQAIVPVRSGYLRDSIYAVVKDWLAEVGATATYAAFVEFGTRYMRARPYLYPALQVYLPSLESVIVSAIEAAKREVGLT